MLFNAKMVVHILMILCFRLTYCAMSERRDLRILGILPMTGGGWPGGTACIPAIKMAIDDVNARDDILNGYRLVYDYEDSMCEASAGVYRMVQALINRPPYVMLSGAICSTASVGIADIAHRWNLTQVSPGSSSIALSDKKRFPTFFRLTVPVEKTIPAMIELMKTFNWRKVATIHQAVESLTVFIDAMTRDFEKNNVSIIAQEVLLGDAKSPASDLKKADARIIMQAMYISKTLEFFCEAYKIGLYGKKIVWLMVGGLGVNFWKEGNDLDCTPDQMSSVVEGAFFFTASNRNLFDELGIANITGEEFDTRFFSHPLYDADYSSFDFNSPKCYDHIWAIALALNCTDGYLRERGHNKTLDEFSYQDADINAIIVECMKNVSFVGVSGRHSFREESLRHIITISRIQGGETQTIGYYTPDEPEPLQWLPGVLNWEGGYIPRDSTVVIQKETVIPDTVYIPMCIMAGCGIVLTCGFLGFNIVFRNNRSIKLSSPNINNILLIGCMLCYLTIFIKTNGVDDSFWCKLRTVLFCLGFTTTFGSLFSKTWRVYKLFTNKKLRRMKIRDIQLFALIALLFGVASTLLIIWEVIGPYTVKTAFLDDEISFIGNDEEVHPFIRVCVSNKSQYFNWIIYIGEGVLLAFGSFLAWETRNVKLEELNDSRQIGLCLYNVVILSAVGLTLSLLLDEQVVMLYGVTSGCLLIGTTVTLCVVFVPKVLAVYRKTYDVTQPKASSSNPGTTATSSSNWIKPPGSNVNDTVGTSSKTAA